MSTIENQPRVSQGVHERAVPTAGAASAREQFIPLRKAELIDLLAQAAGLSIEDSQTFRRFCRLLQAIVHCEYQLTLEDLKNAYAPFDPDADTRSRRQWSREQLAEQQQILFERFNWLLERGNFVRLATSDIEKALSNCSQDGLNLQLDLKIFERLEIYCRGDVVGTRFRRSVARLMRSEVTEVPLYQRLVVIFRLRADYISTKYLDTGDVHVKLFKDIPKMDLEMLLPGTQVRMSMLDRTKILLPTLSGVSITVWKLVQGAIFAAAVGFYGFLAFMGLVGGTIGYALRSFFGYLNTKQKYQLNLTQRLYYQNLDNNAGVIYRLLDEAEEQENREAILAYFFLWREAPPAGWNAAELDSRVESFLRAETDKNVDFEIADALDKLARMNLASIDADGKWTTIGIAAALEALKRRWIALPT